MTRRHALLALCLCLVLGFAGEASAQPNAEGLFREALEDMRRADFVTACPKLSESQRLEPRSGTLISLAFCNERLGRTATAWQNYRDAASLAKEEGREEYVTKANQLAAQLVPKLSNLRIFAPKIDGLVVSVNGRAVDPAELGADIHVDPGSYTVVAEAPDRVTFTKAVEVERQERETITVPELDHAGGITLIEPAPTSPGEPSPGGTSNAGTIAGWTLVGVGGAATVAGLIVGAMVLGKKGVVDDECDQEARTCSQAGLDAKDAGATLATVSTITFVGGLVVAGVGVTVLLLASPDESGEVALTVAPTLGGAALGLEGRF